MANETQRLWDLLTNRLTPTRAGYLDELDFDLDGRLGSPAGASLATDIATVDGVVDTINANVGDPSLDTLITIAAKLGNPAQDLNTMIGYEGATSLADKLTAIRAGYLDAGISSRSSHSEVDVRQSVCSGTDPVGSIGRLLNDYLDKSIASLNDLAQSDILSDATPFAGGNIDAAISSRSSHSEVDVRQSVCAAGDPASSIGKLLYDYLDHSVADLITRTKGLDDIHDDIAALSEKGLGYGSAISGSVTPTDGTENIIVETDGTGDYAQDFEIFLGIDVSVLQAGDTIEIKVYKRVDGTNYCLADSQTLSDAQTIEVWEMDALWGDEVQDLKVTLAQTAGAYRTFNYRGAVRKPA